MRLMRIILNCAAGVVHELPLHFKLTADSFSLIALHGEVPERLNGAVSKTVVLKGTEGSNPSLSARKTTYSYYWSA